MTTLLQLVKLATSLLRDFYENVRFLRSINLGGKYTFGVINRLAFILACCRLFIGSVSGLSQVTIGDCDHKLTPNLIRGVLKANASLVPRRL
jgi:hypothetical protein